jgi:hypothetical protein
MPATGTAKSKNGLKASRRRQGNAAPSQAFDVDTFLATVGIGRTIATYKPKSYIFRQGSDCAGVFYIRKGRVELSVVSKQGKERVVGILGPGTFVGEGCLAGQPLYLASARASRRKPRWCRVEAATMIRRFATIPSFPSASWRFSCCATARSRRTWSISCSIPEREAPGTPAHPAGADRAASGIAHGHHADQPGAHGGAHRHAHSRINYFARQVPQAPDSSDTTAS